MKIVLQRVNFANVRVGGKVVGEIEKGLLVFLGIEEKDEQSDVVRAVQKIVNLRIFADANDKTNLSIKNVDGEMLVVSQFTLLADCKKGNRPSFVNAGSPQKANELYEFFVGCAKKEISKVEKGIFGEDMKVSLENDGPFTIVLDRF